MFEFLQFGNLQITWRDVLDIALVGFVFYRLILLIKGTRAVSVVYGLLGLLIIYHFSGEFGFFTLNWLLANFLGSIFLVVIILFQRDIRKALAQMGAGRFWTRSQTVSSAVMDELILALMEMARKRIGALVVLEKNMPLGDVIERGVELGAVVSRDLMLTIFHPDTPLHDGAAVIRGNKILAAGCILPLSVGMKHRSELGTRHRAAMGITEETDAIAVVVSEERGTVSVAIGGRLTSSLDEIRLKRVLSKVLE
ncbi:MAG: diadenylate cyclase CdaA [Desulfovibrionales bacterium]